MRACFSLILSNNRFFNSCSYIRRHDAVRLLSTTDVLYNNPQQSIRYQNNYFSTLSSSSIKILKRNNTATKKTTTNITKYNNDYDERMIQLLMEYKNKYGDVHVPTINTPLIKKERQQLNISDELVRWIIKQRKIYKYRQQQLQQNSKKKNSNKFTHQLQQHSQESDENWISKQMILESIGFIWSSREAHWYRFYNRLKQYQEVNGNLQVKRSEDLQLYNWTDHQRKVYKRGDLPLEKETMLRDTGFRFNPQEYIWWGYYDKLCEYREKHGDTLVPTGDYEDDQGLSTWVARQRAQYRDEQLSEERINALNDIGFAWDAQRESWDNFYDQLCQFYKQHNHTRVPRSAGQLWNWVDRQRRELKKLVDENKSQSQIQSDTSLDEGNLKKLLDLGLLDTDNKNSGTKEDRAKRLLDLTFEVAVHEERWMKMWNQLSAFKEKYGHCSVPSENPELSKWVRQQRYLFHSKKMSEDRIALLNSIDFAWTAKDARWNKLCGELVTFHQENGHANIPVTNAVLYRWTNQQKRKLLSQKKSKSSDEKVQALQQILLEKSSST